MLELVTCHRPLVSYHLILMSMIQPRRFAPDDEADVYDDGYLRVEHDNYYISCNGQRVDFPRSEFLIVSRLARNPERIVCAEELWQVAWGDYKPYNPVSLRVYIYRLRSKLEPFGLRIETMIGVGYRLHLATVEKAGELH